MPLISIPRPFQPDSMLTHYGVEDATAAGPWRTVTPAALPQSATRRRVEPSRLLDPAERKGASERGEEQNRAVGAVVQALRHAGIAASATGIRVQRGTLRRKRRTRRMLR